MGAGILVGVGLRFCTISATLVILFEDFTVLIVGICWSDLCPSP